MQSPPSGSSEPPVLQFARQQDWENWLESNHAVSAGVWLKIAKKDSGVDTVSYAEALEAALADEEAAEEGELLAEEEPPPPAGDN